jgi:hypothetical protein
MTSYPPMMAQFSSQQRYCNRWKWRVMLPTILSEGTIVHSALLTKFSATGCYQLPPRVLSNKISTQQPTWMKMIKSTLTTASTKERGNGKGVTEATDMWLQCQNLCRSKRNTRDIRQWCWRWRCQSQRLTITTFASASVRTARGDASVASNIHWGQWQGDGVWQWRQCRYNDSTGKARASGG